MSSDEIWHLVEARRDDGSAAMFRIRELDARTDQPTIFVVELPYATAELSRLPDAAAYRRLAQFEEQWLRPACTALDWTFVAAKTEAGSMFLYLYGATASLPLIEKLAPFDVALAFFDEHDPTWDEYAALRELLAEANTLRVKKTPVIPRPPAPVTKKATTKKATTTKPAKARAKAKVKAKTKKRTR